MNLFKTAALAAAFGLMWGCGSKSTPTPTAPTYTFTTDTFTDGVLLQNADINAPDFGPADAPHRITVTQASAQFPGEVDVTIATLSPLSTITVGIGLTTWNNTTQSCDLPLQLTTSSGKVGVTVSGPVYAPGDLCVALYDVGNVQGTSTYTLNVVHN